MKNENIYPLRIHIEDTDCTGTVYHANYLNFMERARSEWIDSLGFGIAEMRKHQMQFLIHSIKIDFLHPAFIHEKVEVVSVLKEMKRASMTFHQHLRGAVLPHKILCKAEIRIVCVDFNLRPKVLPDIPIFRAIRKAVNNEV